jgi:hypothetical protein
MRKLLDVQVDRSIVADATRVQRLALHSVQTLQININTLIDIINRHGKRALETEFEIPTDPNLPHDPDTNPMVNHLRELYNDMRGSLRKFNPDNTTDLPRYGELPAQPPAT